MIEFTHHMVPPVKGQLERVLPILIMLRGTQVNILNTQLVAY